MDSYLLTYTNRPSVYYQGKDDGNIINLGLSLRVLQPEAFHPSEHGHDVYGDLVEWHQLHPKTSNFGYPRKAYEEVVDKTDIMIQNKEQPRGYVKVNMEGVIVGRKICLLDHSDYSSLAFQLEDMFGRQTLSSLRLFQSGSEFSLFYTDGDDQWRTVGDVPWKEFLKCVKRLRIMRKVKISFPSAAALV